MAPTTRSSTAQRPAAAPSARLAAKITAADLARIAPAPRAAPGQAGMQKKTTAQPAQDPAPDAPRGAAAADALITELEGEVARLGQRCVTLQQEVEDLQAGAEESRRRLERIAEELEESEHDRAGAERKLEEEREAHAATLRALTAKTEERMQLWRELAPAKKKSDDLTLELAEARVQISRLAEEGAAARAALSVEREARNVTAVGHAEAARTIMRLMDEVAGLKNTAGMLAAIERLTILYADNDCNRAAPEWKSAAGWDGSKHTHIPSYKKEGDGSWAVVMARTDRKPLAGVAAAAQGPPVPPEWSK